MYFNLAVVFMMRIEDLKFACYKEGSKEQVRTIIDHLSFGLTIFSELLQEVTIEVLLAPLWCMILQGK